MEPERKALRIPAAAEAAGVSKRTIYNRIKAGRLETKAVHNSTLIYIDSLLACFSSRRRRRRKEAQADV